MKADGFLLYAECCDELMRWEGTVTTKIRCACGESGGVHQTLYSDQLATEILMEFFYLWGDCVPVRIEEMENVADAISGDSPVFSKEFFGRIRIFTAKSEDIRIERYENEEEFDESVDYHHSVDIDPERKS